MSHLVPGAAKQAITVYARQLGFELCGVTTPATPPHFDVFARWIAEGKHGEMGYLATERSLQCREDPRLLLPDCCSVLVLGTPYPSPLQNAPREGSDSEIVTGRVAAYAWGMDYHNVLDQRLQKLVGFIEKLIGTDFPYRCYSDTGPVLERDLGQRAGLGWIGKNTCLINPELGSNFFISELLLGLELETDPPFRLDRCGKCTRCQEACPTQCILPDRTMDARRCLSYLTIEQKGIIPVGLRPMLGDHVFGCDICQEVCPWNTAPARRVIDPAFEPREGVRDPDLVRAMELDLDAFAKRYSNNPLKRAKRAGYLRNVAVCLGNAHNLLARPALAKALSDPEPLIRAHAAWALGEIGGEEARSMLKSAQTQEVDPAVQSEIRFALTRLAE
jgi:epoxyqueuosine reductase